MRIDRLIPGDKQTRQQVTTCFREVFGGKKWKEWMKCPSCQRQWSKSATPEDKTCSDCQQGLVPYWPPKKVNDIIKSLTDNEMLSAWTMRHKQKLIGFCWGYTARSENWSDKIDQELSKLQRPIGYQSEMGLIPQYREQGLASQLYRKRGRDFLQSGVETLLVRTKGPNAEGDPSTTYCWYKQLGYSTIFEYEDGRVLQAVNIDHVKEYILHGE